MRTVGKRGPAGAPRRYLGTVLLIVLAALGLHGYEHIVESATGFSLGWFLWAMLPYGICLAGLALAPDGLPVAVAAAVALGFDALAFHAVFIRPTGSTAALLLIWAPIWNTLLLVPGTMLLTWLFMRWVKRA